MKHVNIIKMEHANTHIYLHADYMKISRCHQYSRCHHHVTKMSSTLYE